MRVGTGLQVFSSDYPTVHDTTPGTQTLFRRIRTSSVKAVSESLEQVIGKSYMSSFPRKRAVGLAGDSISSAVGENAGVTDPRMVRLDDGGEFLRHIRVVTRPNPSPRTFLSAFASLPFGLTIASGTPVGCGSCLSLIAGEPATTAEEEEECSDVEVLGTSRVPVAMRAGPEGVMARLELWGSMDWGWPVFESISRTFVRINVSPEDLAESEKR